MQNYPKELTDMEHMNKLFDCIRLIDVDHKTLYHEHCIHTYANYIPAFDYEQRQDIYYRCLELDSAIYEIKQEGNYLMIYTVMQQEIVFCMNFQ